MFHTSFIYILIPFEFFDQVYRVNLKVYCFTSTKPALKISVFLCEKYFYVKQSYFKAKEQKIINKTKQSLAMKTQTILKLILTLNTKLSYF